MNCWMDRWNSCAIKVIDNRSIDGDGKVIVWLYNFWSEEIFALEYAMTFGDCSVELLRMFFIQNVGFFNQFVQNTL